MDSFVDRIPFFPDKSNCIDIFDVNMIFTSWILHFVWERIFGWWIYHIVNFIWNMLLIGSPKGRHWDPNPMGSQSQSQILGLGLGLGSIFQNFGIGIGIGIDFSKFWDWDWDWDRFFKILGLGLGLGLQIQDKIPRNPKNPKKSQRSL